MIRFLVHCSGRSETRSSAIVERLAAGRGPESAHRRRHRAERHGPLLGPDPGRAAELAQCLVPVREVDGKIEFRNVSFTYPDTGIKALKDISFVVNPGESLAIIGNRNPQNTLFGCQGNRSVFALGMFDGIL